MLIHYKATPDAAWQTTPLYPNGNTTDPAFPDAVWKLSWSCVSQMLSASAVDAHEARFLLFAQSRRPDTGSLVCRLQGDPLERGRRRQGLGVRERDEQLKGCNLRASVYDSDE